MYFSELWRIKQTTESELWKWSYLWTRLGGQHDLNCIFCAGHKLKIAPKLKKNFLIVTSDPPPYLPYSTGDPP